jgi:hypothetical protein
MNDTVLASSKDSRDKAGVFDGVLYHFSRHLVEDNVSHLHANAFC